MGFACSRPPLQRPAKFDEPHKVQRPQALSPSATEVPPARVALLEAVARGRQVPATIKVRPAASLAHSPEVAAAFEGLEVEELQYCSEVEDPAGPSSSGSGSSSGTISQVWVPLRLVRQPEAPSQQQRRRQRLPVAVLLHATGVDMGSLVTQQAAFARRGYLAATIDCRYHGARSMAGVGAWEGYQQALVRAWRGSGERPFLLDNIWDIQRLLDYLQHRPDVDAARIGMTGVSLGGMHTWLAAAVDERVAVAAPMIGVQHFGWAVKQRRYLGRVQSIPHVFQAAAADLALKQQQAQLQQQEQVLLEQLQGGGGSGGGSSGEEELSPEVVTAVWNLLLPGLLELFDAPHSLPLIAPRPLLIANGELDPRCHMQGVEAALPAVREAYAAHGAADNFQLYVEPGCDHCCTEGMWEQVTAFMDKHLLLEQQGQGGGAGGQLAVAATDG